jgi:hypothetical protein
MAQNQQSAKVLSERVATKTAEIFHPNYSFPTRFNISRIEAFTLIPQIAVPSKPYTARLNWQLVQYACSVPNLLSAFRVLC